MTPGKAPTTIFSVRPSSLRNLGRLLAWIVFAGVAVASEDISVSAVRFRTVTPVARNSGSWLEAEVMLAATPVAGRTVNRVGVELTVGFELPGAATPAGSSEKRVDYYRAAAECVALESGRTGVRFYLPPELVKRDQLHGDPKFWSVALAVGGKPVAAGRANWAIALADDAARKGFQASALAAAPANDGLFQPQYLTPFALEYPRTTPSFVRREAVAPR